MPKPVYAIVDDVTALESKLMAANAKTEASIAPAVNNAEQRLQSAIQKVTDTMAANASSQSKESERIAVEGKQYTDKSLQNLHEQLVPQFTTLQKSIDALQQKFERDMKEQNTKKSEELQKTIEELCSNMSEELNELSANLQGKINDAKKEMLQADEKQGEEITAAIDKVKKDGIKMTKLTKEDLEKKLEDFKTAQATTIKAMNDKSELMQNDIFLKLGRHDDEIKEGAEKSESALRAAEETLKGLIDELKTNTNNRLNYLDAEADKLRNAVAEVENVSTKKVDWVIQNVAKRIRPTSASKASLHRSWFSPKFNIAGAHGLQLELQLFKPSEIPAKDEEAGDAAVFLWACKGMTLNYRLYIGTKYQTIEKTFNGRVPYGTTRFCFLKDQINRNDDTVTVSVEILESHREIQHTIEIPPDPEVPEGVDPPERALDGHVFFHRYVNNRLYDQVKNQVDLMRSRMIRRVEWRVEQASRLRTCFPTGECICSTQFNAAGIEGLQLIFYPSGYNGVSDGFCSLYLYGPAGCTLKCNLCLGAQKREAHHSFSEPGAFGRTNFCRFEQIVDGTDDTVMVALEIEEAHQDHVAQVAHPLVTPGDKRSQAQIDGTGPSAINSVVKLRTAPGKAAQGLEDTRVLPSLWTAAFQESLSQPADGMHSFEELKGKPAKGGRRAAANSSLPSPGGLQGSTSMPSLTGVSDGRTFASGFDDTSPLSRLANTTSATFGAAAVSGQSKRRPRRGMSSTTSQFAISAC